MLDIPSYPESAIGPTIVGPEEKNFKVKILIWNEDRDSFLPIEYFIRDPFCSSYAELKENVLDILSYLEPTLGPTMVGPGEKNPK